MPTGSRSTKCGLPNWLLIIQRIKKPSLGLVFFFYWWFFFIHTLPFTRAFTPATWLAPHCRCFFLLCRVIRAVWLEKKTQLWKLTRPLTTISRLGYITTLQLDMETIGNSTRRCYTSYKQWWGQCDHGYIHSENGRITWVAWCWQITCGLSHQETLVVSLHLEDINSING